ncbi:hypothetical protein QC764_610210 [Podospora pseudoanserina]|uniref:Uncharacterized protein n=1 Tax=Podospora pseudoanserina TaxID=2609844 RepID=A0ABR0HVI5_9PEZI|nr:hypothetical protein QC764_610210 [Podospora pseudoanserina]
MVVSRGLGNGYLRGRCALRSRHPSPISTPTFKSISTMQLLAILTTFPLTALAVVNGRCSGSAATGTWGQSGICISTGTCNSFGGVFKSGACPGDAADIRCCLIGLEGSTNKPCGAPRSYCDWDGHACWGVTHSGENVPVRQIIGAAKVCK